MQKMRRQKSAKILKCVRFKQVLNLQYYSWLDSSMVRASACRSEIAGARVQSQANSLYLKLGSLHHKQVFKLHVCMCLDGSLVERQLPVRGGASVQAQPNPLYLILRSLYHQRCIQKNKNPLNLNAPQNLNAPLNLLLGTRDHYHNNLQI